MNQERKKYIEQWWRKYEAMGDLDAEFPPSPEAFFSCLNSTHRAMIQSGKSESHLEDDIEHHLKLQKTFVKWHRVHGE